MRQLLVAANIVPSSPFLVSLIMEALSSSETSVRTRAIWHSIPEDTILENTLRLRQDLNLVLPKFKSGTQLSDPLI
jgi:hypothetical protein